MTPKRRAINLSCFFIIRNIYNYVNIRKPPLKGCSEIHLKIKLLSFGSSGKLHEIIPDMSGSIREGTLSCSCFGFPVTSCFLCYDGVPHYVV